MSSAVTASPAKEYLYRLEEYKKQASTRKDAYKRVSLETGLSSNSLRLAASRTGQTKTGRSLKYAFSEEEEKALVTVCLMYARQNMPLTLKDFIILASIYAKREEGHYFTYPFVSDFVERHSDVLKKKEGKVTSPRRCIEAMQKNTQDFVESMDMIMALNIINKNNLVVFDETVIGEDGPLPIVIAEDKDEAGNNANVNQTRGQRLGTYIPFSMPDGSTPYRVFIFRSGNLKDGETLKHAVGPTWEKGLRDDPYRLFLSSKSGFMTTELFDYIMEDFTNWWRTTHPGLHCFLVCDNLSIHCNNAIARKAWRQGIHFLYIMPGSSHWFQVHDQTPFANLKNLMVDLKSEIMPSDDIAPEDRKMISMTIFYNAEKKAFSKSNIIRSFAKVGLWPWNPKKILAICEKFCPVQCQQDTDRAFFALAEAVKQRDEKRISECCDKVSQMKPVAVVSLKSIEKRKSHDEVDTEDLLEEEESYSVSRPRKAKDILTRPPAKRTRQMSATVKTCCVNGCQKTHFRSKKWKICPKCHANFCPSHVTMFDHHTC